MKDLPLGRDTPYPDRYAPQVLAPVSRADARRNLGVRDALPFTGVDIWNAWELSWLEPGGKPRVAAAEIRVPADSPCIVESKSLKLYLNGYAMTACDSAEVLRRRIAGDVGGIVGSDVEVSLHDEASAAIRLAAAPGTCLDSIDADCRADRVDASLLAAAGNDVIDETLYSHLLRSLCPVTGQPDFGSLLVRYRGRRIDAAGLLRYIVSYRQHTDFHEACVERIFLDIMARCECERLTVYARYNRRGGIDINPFRTNSGESADNLRLWRQ